MKTSLPVHQVVEITETVRGAVDKFDLWATHVKENRDNLEKENHCHLLLSSVNNDIFEILKGWEIDVFVIPYIEKRKCRVKKFWTRVQRLTAYTGSQRICPAVNVILLCSTFAVIRVKNPTKPALFVSLRGKRATLGRWIRDILLEAGNRATAGTCQSAATSAAYMRKLPIDVILSSAGWSSNLMFFKHYQREVDPTFVGANLLPPL